MSTNAPPRMISVCPAEELSPGEARVVEIDPPIAVFNVDGVFYAIDDTCSHAKASLADGDLEGCYVECPFHASQFDLRTGEPNGLPASLPVATHTVEIRSGVLTVLVGVSPR
ncbi:MAG: bifunctional 3-phenylpropionate/cinnamic acid dioxygenase ferredoxin subunit [Mycobacterium sp.]